ncbi:MAG: hypothetical protein U0U69_06120 [Acidimicrobiia bacterium]
MHPQRYELDTVPPPLRPTTTGVSALVPGVVAPLTWTSAGAAVEYALRIACCSTLPLLPWPRPSREWVMSGLVDAIAVVDDEVLAQAARHVIEHPRRMSLRAARARRNPERRGEADLAYVSAMRDGRMGQVMSERTVDDLLLTSSRLLEVVFRALADHTGATLAAGVSRGAVATGEDVARCLDVGRPLPLWHVDKPQPARNEGDRRGPAASACVLAAAELKATVDELGRRWSDTRALEVADDVAFLRWDELPEVAGGRIDAAGCQDRVTRRKADLAACSAGLAS